MAQRFARLARHPRRVQPVQAPLGEGCTCTSLSLCVVSNHIRRHTRPGYIAHREFTPIECLPDDCLVRPYPAQLPWQDGMPASARVTSSEELAVAA